MIDKIIAIEWEMFNNVRNINGRASCQDDWETFEIMRKSQFMCWSEKTCLSYLEDLEVAKAIGRNLIQEKYAYMMATTDPKAYQEIQPLLPVIEKDRQALIDGVVAIEVEMTESFYAQYPILKTRARPIHTSQDRIDETSSETYLRAELATYSPNTLISYIQDVLTMVENGINLIEQTVQNELIMYGYHSLDDPRLTALVVD